MSKARRVLLIDDNIDAAESLAQLLALSGHDARIAADGVRGIALAEDFRPEVVFCDLGLPGMSGFEVASALRERPETADLPVVVLTAHELDAEDRARLQDKIEALVHKGPLAPSRLVTAIRGLADRRAGGDARG